MCEALRSSLSLAGQKTVSAASSSRKCRKYNVRFPMNINIESPIIFADTMDTRSTRRPQVKHDHRRRADRAPQIAVSFTQNERRAHWHIQWGKLRPDRIGAEMVTSAPCPCKPEGSLSAEQTRPLVKHSSLTLSRKVVHVLYSHQSPTTHYIFGHGTRRVIPGMQLQPLN